MGQEWKKKLAFLAVAVLAVRFPGVRSGILCALLALGAGRLGAVPLSVMERRGLPRWLGGVLLVIVGVGLLLTVAWFGLARLCSGIECLMDCFPNVTALLRRLQALAEPLNGSIGAALREVLGYFSRKSEALPNLFTAQAAKASKWLLSAMPQKLLFLFMTTLASYYAAVDWEQLRPILDRAVPVHWRHQLHGILRSLKKGCSGWLRVQGKLVLLQSALLSGGFLFLGIEGAVLSALLTAAADALPLLGTGAVLLPWSAALWLMEEPGKAAGMLVLWLCSWTLRAVLEPRLVGHQAGVSPFFTVAGMYLGLRCFGVAGMITGAVLLSSLGPSSSNKKAPSDR